MNDRPHSIHHVLVNDFFFLNVLQDFRGRGRTFSKCRGKGIMRKDKSYQGTAQWYTGLWIIDT